MNKSSWLLAMGLISSCISAVALQAARADCPQAVKIIVPQPPGGPDDLIARILAQRLSQAGSRFYVENMPGATGAIGTAAAARAVPDGWTISLR
jgi:tripartite-type tricarboxylate transporter receptor subunit TctC